mgnify:CR=1 FL=1
MTAVRGVYMGSLAMWGVGLWGCNGGAHHWDESPILQVSSERGKDHDLLSRRLPTALAYTCHTLSRTRYEQRECSQAYTHCVLGATGEPGRDDGCDGFGSDRSAHLVDWPRVLPLAAVLVRRHTSKAETKEGATDCHQCRSNQPRGGHDDREPEPCCPPLALSLRTQDESAPYPDEKVGRPLKQPQRHKHSGNGCHGGRP